MRFRSLLTLMVGLLGFTAPLAGTAWAAGSDGGHEEHEGHAHGENAIRITQWDDRYEVFAEHPPIVAGEPTEFVVHLTRLADGAPRTGGPLTFHCESTKGAILEHTAASPARAGIYEVQLTYPAHGKWQLTLLFPTSDGQERLVLPPIQVHRTAEDAADAAAPVPPEGIAFLKEQQWPLPMLTAPAVDGEVAGERGVTIPSSATFVGAQEPIAFVQLDGETFEERHLVLGKGDGTHVKVISGIDQGERVVTQGVAELSRAAEQGAGHEDHGAHETQVEMSDADLNRFNIVVGQATSGQIRSEIDVPGEIALDDHRTAQIVALVPGMVGELSVALGDEVHAGQVVAILISRELADAKADYLAAMQREELAAAGFAREERLQSEQISSEQEFIEARHANSEARILTRSARQKLVAMGLSESQIRDLPTEADSQLTRFEIRAPFAGSIIERDVTRGEVVTADTPLFMVADLRTVWLDLHVPDRELQRIGVGQSVKLIKPSAVNGFSGTVEYVHPIVDERSRTVLVRATLPNPDGLLRPGQYVTARIAAEQVTVPVVVPQEAIQYLNDEPVVFVREGGQFVPRTVALGGSTGNMVAVVSGLNPGERLATHNSFLIKSEIEKRTAGEAGGHGHAH